MSSANASDAHTKLLAMLDQGRAAHDAFVATLSQTERELVGTADAWQPKDHIAHLNYWRARGEKALRAALGEGEPPDTGTGFQPQNERNFADWQHATWEAVTVETSRLHASARALLSRVSAQDLTEQQRFPWQNANNSIARSLCVQYYGHPVEHYAEVGRTRGQVEPGRAALDAAVTFMRDLFGATSAEYTDMAYNSACFFGREGMPQRAIELLGQALPLRPDLVEWSKTDPDLESLRSLPEFQALYA